MMKTVNTITKTLAFTALLLLSSLGQANTKEALSAALSCDSLSPSLEQLGDQYFFLEPDPASVPATEIAMLETIYASLKGRWRGHWTDQYCVGSGETARLRSKSRQFKRVHADVHDQGQLSFRADGLKIDLASASELTSLEIVDKNTLVMTRRYQRGTVLTDDQPRHAALRERHDTLTLLGKELQLETRWYINGFYSGTEVTRLRKVR